MSLHFHSWARWRIHRLFTSGLSATRHRALLKELGTCPDCSAVFREYHAFEAILCGAQEEPNGLAAERMACAVFGSLPAEKTARASGRRALGLLAPTAVLACVVLVFFLGRGARPVSHRVPVGEDSKLTPTSVVARGQGAAPDANTGIRLLRVMSREAKVDEASELLLSDVVTFTYTNLRKETRYLALLGIQEGGAVRWYYPGQESNQSILIEPDRIDEPLNDGIRLSVFHHAGWLRIAAVFSSEPIEKRVVERAVRVLAERDGALEGLEPLPLGISDSVEDSIRVELGAPVPGGRGGAR